MPWTSDYIGHLQRRKMKKHSGKAGHIMLLLIALICACAVLSLGLLWVWSPGKPRAIVDEHGQKPAGSLSEKVYVQINGVRQGMFIESGNIANPVLLVVHGGPGCPDYMLTQAHPTGLEKHFTVCWWEQRGAGMSYNPHIPADSMTVKQMVSDAIAVTNYLRGRFKQDKIYLLGHSWGTLIGMYTAQKAPELYRAYIAMSQISRQPESEKLAYDYMLEWYKAAGDEKMLRRLEAAPFGSKGYQGLRDEAMHKAGIGTMHTMKSVITGIVLPALRCPQYSLGEKIAFVRGLRFSSASGLKDEIGRADMPKEVPELKIPVYFFSGRYDYTVAYPLAKAYFEAIKAPVKGFYTFENSAHSPLFEEPEKANRILEEDVLAGKSTLSDK
jgi:pimeloyl-ACP methyl ester carboxylesterase